MVPPPQYGTTMRLLQTFQKQKGISGALLDCKWACSHHSCFWNRHLTKRFPDSFKKWLYKISEQDWFGPMGAECLVISLKNTQKKYCHGFLHSVLFFYSLFFMPCLSLGSSLLARDSWSGAVTKAPCREFCLLTDTQPSGVCLKKKKSFCLSPSQNTQQGLNWLPILLGFNFFKSLKSLKFPGAA